MKDSEKDSSPPRNVTSQDERIEETTNFKMYFLFAFLTIILPFLFIVGPFKGSKTSNFIKPVGSKKLLEVLNNEFKSQSRSFHSSLISCYNHSILESKDPSVILLVADRNNKESLNCIARKLLKALNIATHGDNLDYNYLIVDTKHLSRNEDEAKMQLDLNFKKIFKDLKRNIALVEDLNNIPPQSMILFYAYGDDASNSKYNGIIILITFVIDEVFDKIKFDKLSTDYAMLSSFVEMKLNEKWSNDIDYDQLKPLYTRIGNNIILVGSEKSCDKTDEF